MMTAFRELNKSFIAENAGLTSQPPHLIYQDVQTGGTDWNTYLSNREFKILQGMVMKEEPVMFLSAVARKALTCSIVMFEFDLLTIVRTWRNKSQQQPCFSRSFL